jgi:hypothetical protein
MRKNIGKRIEPFALRGYSQLAPEHQEWEVAKRLIHLACLGKCRVLWCGNPKKLRIFV